MGFSNDKIMAMTHGAFIPYIQNGEFWQALTAAVNSAEKVFYRDEFLMFDRKTGRQISDGFLEADRQLLMTL
jgi:hypothetical protein